MEGWLSGNGTGLLHRGWGWRPTRVRSARLPLMEDEPAWAGPAWKAGEAGDRRGIRASVFRVWKLNRPSDKRPDQVQLLGLGPRRDSSAGRAPASYAGGR